MPYSITNNDTEVVDNGRGFRNEEDGRDVATEGRPGRVAAESYTYNQVGGKRGETARVGNGESAKARTTNTSEGDGYKLWETSKIVDRNKQVTEEANTAYLKAVKSGDLDTAQKFIDALAEIKFPESVVRNSDGKLEKQTHGTTAIFDAFNSFSEMGNHFGTRTAAERLDDGTKMPYSIT